MYILCNTTSKTSLEKVIEINNLLMLDYFYNAIAVVKDDNGKETYHVAYERKINIK